MKILERKYSAIFLYSPIGTQLGNVPYYVREKALNKLLYKIVAWGSVEKDKKKIACCWVNGNPYLLDQFNPEKNNNILSSKITGKYSTKRYLMFCVNVKYKDGKKSAFLTTIEYVRVLTKEKGLYTNTPQMKKILTFKLPGSFPTVLGINNKGIAFGCIETKENTLPCYWKTELKNDKEKGLKMLVKEHVVTKAQGLKQNESLIPVWFNGEFYICNFYLNIKQAKLKLPVIRPTEVNLNGTMSILPVPVKCQYGLATMQTKFMDKCYIVGKINDSKCLWTRKNNYWTYRVYDKNDKVYYEENIDELKLKSNDELKRFDRYSVIY